jgi:hypothetical protein
MKRALFAQLDSPERLVEAICALRAIGCASLEAHAPYPVPEAEEALGLGRTRIGYAAFVAALVGAFVGYAVQQYSTSSYPLNVGGFPLFSVLAFVPISFETAVLFSALTVFFSFFVTSGAPRLWAPIDEAEGFERITRDRFGVLIHSPDLESVRLCLESIGISRIVEIQGEPG